MISFQISKFKFQIDRRGLMLLLGVPVVLIGGFFLTQVVVNALTGPVAYWKMDEGTGTTAKDSTTNANNGTLSGSTKPTWQADDLCISGKCLYFNGSTSYITVTDQASQRPANVTLAAWVRSNTAGRYVIAKDPPDPTKPGEEILKDRTYNQKVISLGNDKRRAEIHAGHIHYKDPITGEFKDIDTTLLPTVDGWQMDKASYRLKLPRFADQWFSFTNQFEGKASDTISIKPVGVTHTEGVLSFDDQWKGRKVLYKNAYGTNTDLLLLARNTGFDKWVRINQKPSDLSRDLEFSFEVALDDFSVVDLAGTVWDRKLPLLTSKDIILEKAKKTWFREFRMWDSSGKSTGIKVRLDFVDGKYILTKILDKGFLEKAVYPVYTDTTTSYYAGAGDGEVGFSATSTWATAHDAATGDNANNTNTTTIADSFSSGGTIEIERAFFPFDTSGIAANATITAASFNIYPTITANNDNDGKDYITVVQTSQASSTTLTTADYDTNGSAVTNPTEGIDVSERKDITSISTGAYLTINLNSTGLGWIKKSGQTANCGTTAGVTCLGYREGHDTTNEEPAADNTVIVNTSEQTGTANDPYLSVTYTVPKTNVPYSLDTTSGGRFLIRSSSTDYTVTAGGDINDNKWHYLVATYDGTTMKVYVDGVLKNSGTSFSGNLPSDTGPLNIGADYQETPANFFNGFLDEVKIYNYARSADQIKGDFNSRAAAVAKGASAAIGVNRTDPLSDGLIGYWKMDDNSGTSGTDASGNGKTLTLNSASWGTGKFGPGWNGTGAVWLAQAADDANFDFAAAEDFTISLWYKSDSATNPAANETIMNKTGSGIGYQLFARTSGEIAFGIDSSGGGGYEDRACQDGVDRYDAAWHLFTVVKSGTTEMRCYIDGELKTTTTLTQTGTLENAGTFRVGDSDGVDNGSEFNGDLDEVRVYRRAFSNSEVSQLYNFAPGPVGYWKMEEGQGTTITDSQNGIASSAFTGNVVWGQGKYGKGLVFDGIDSVVRIPETSAIDLGATTDSFSVEGWFKTSKNSTTSQAIVYKDDGVTNVGFQLRLTGTEVPFFRIHDGTNGPSITGTTAMNDGVWHHYAGVRDVLSDTLYLYVDGVLIGSTADTTTATVANNDDVSIGNGDTSYTNVDAFGSIDEAKIYNYARTQKQIVEDMNGGHPTGGSPVGSQVAYWKFNELNGDKAYDSSSNGNTADLGTSSSTCPGASACPLWTLHGKQGGALQFDGSDDYLEVTDNAGLRPTRITLSAWIKSNATDRYVIAKDPPGEGGKIAPDGEIIDKRTYTTKVFTTRNGKEKAEVHLGQIHYVDPNNGKMEEIDTRFIPEAGGWKMNKASYQLKLPQFADESFDYVNNYGGKKSDRFSLKALGVSHVSGQLANFDKDGWAGKAIRYADAFGQDVDLELRARNMGFDKLVVLNAKPADLSVDLKFQFELDLHGFVIRDSENKVWDGAKPLVTSKSFKLERLQETFFKDFMMWDSGGKSQAIRVMLQKKGNTYVLTKILDRSFLASATYPVYTDATGTYYTGSGDGYVGNSGTVWSTVHDAASGSVLNTAQTNGIRGDNSFFTPNFAIYRPYLPFDTSSIPSDAAINSAILTLTTSTAIGNNDNNGRDYVTVVRATTAGASLASGDYDTIGDAVTNPTEGIDTGQRLDITGKTTNTAYSFTLNSTGLGWVKRSGESSTCAGAANGMTCLGIRLGNDAENVSVSTSTTGNWIYFYASEQTGTSQDPYLTITYTPQVHQSSKTNVPYALNTVGGGEFFIKSNGTNYYATASGNINDGAWHHLAGTYDGAAMKLYVDGVLKATNKTLSGDLPSDTGSLRIGADYGTAVANFFNGMIDEVKIYSGALTEEQIKIDYNLGSAVRFGVLGTSTADGQTASNSAAAAYCVPGDTSTCNPPVGEWNFEDGSGSTVVDTSSGGKNGTWQGTLTDVWTSGKTGKAGKFNGTNNYLTIANNYQGYDDMTMEAWVMPLTLYSDFSSRGFLGAVAAQGCCNWATLIGYAGSSTADRFGMTIVYNSAGDGTKHETPGLTKYSVGRWYYVVGVLSGGTTTKLYVNGVLEATGTLPGARVNTSANWTINNVYGSTYSNVLLDQVRLYNYARTPGQVAYTYSRGLPQTWWKFDECTGTTAQDSVGTVSGTLSGTVGDCTSTAGGRLDGATGKHNYGISFAAASEVTKVSSTNTYPFSVVQNNSASWGGWFKPTNFTGSPVLIDKGNTFKLSTDTSGNAICAIYNSGAYTPTSASGTTLSTTAWNHVICTYDGTNIKTYINGVLASSVNSTGGISVGLTNLVVGQTTGGANQYTGLGDEIKVWPYALTAYQVRTDFNQGSAVRFGPSTGSP